MGVEARGRAHEACRDFGNLFARQSGIDLIGGVVLAEVIGRPIVRQFAEMRNFGELAGFTLFVLIFPSDSFRDRRGVDAGLRGIELPERRMVLDAFVKARLSDRGVVDFAVAVAAVADQVDDHVGIEFCAIFRGDAPNAHNRVRIFRIDMEDGYALAVSDAGGETGGVLLNGARSEADQIVDDDVDRATNRVSGEVGEVQRLRPDALSGEGGITVHDDGPNLIENFLRAVDDRPVSTVTRLLGPGAAHGNGIDSFQVAWIGDQVNIEF